jgi:UDPglucose--hexose-1-phosphate uridylyltransferase
MSELRRDYLVDRWVSVAPERAKRPRRKEVKDVIRRETICPFCPGNEHLTPPATLAIRLERGERLEFKDEGDIRHKNWIVRCFPNLYPAFTAERKRASSVSEFRMVRAFGFHEVIVETPAHDENWWNIQEDQLVYMFKALMSRYRSMMETEGIKYVLPFKNSGLSAGASIEHSHMQMIALSILPREIKGEVKGFTKGRCPYCEAVSKEVGSGERVVFEDRKILVLAPWASRVPYELLILPRDHEPSFIETSKNTIRSLAHILRKSFGALREILGDFDFNAWIHTIPSLRDEFHWHLEVLPRTSIWAGLELGGGVYINVLPPEKAAEDLRQHEA